MKMTIVLMMCAAMAACAVDEPTTSATTQGLQCGGTCDPAVQLILDTAYYFGLSCLGSGASTQQTGPGQCTDAPHPACYAPFYGCIEGYCGTYTVACYDNGSSSCWWRWDN